MWWKWKWRFSLRPLNWSKHATCFLFGVLAPQATYWLIIARLLSGRRLNLTSLADLWFQKHIIKERSLFYSVEIKLAPEDDYLLCCYLTTNLQMTKLQLNLLVRLNWYIVTTASFSTSQQVEICVTKEIIIIIIIIEKASSFPRSLINIIIFGKVIDQIAWYE